MTEEEVRNLSNNQVIVTINRESSIGLPRFLSSKSSVTISRPDGFVLGTLKFHETTSAMDFSVNGRESKLKNDGSFSEKWAWRPMFEQISPAHSEADKWYWKLKKGSGTLEDKRKDGHVIARIEEGILTLERPLNTAAFEEVLVTAIAVKDRARRDKKNKDSAEGVEGILEMVLAG